MPSVPQKQIKIDFFEVEMPDGAGGFSQVIKKAKSTPDNEERTLTINGEPIRLAEISKHPKKKCYELDLVRIRMDELPDRVKMSGERKDLGLEEDEGLGAETACLYSPKLKIIAIQRNRNAVSARRVAGYFTAIGGLEEPILFHPVLHAEAFDDMCNMVRHAKLSIRVAGLKNMKMFGDSLGLKQLNTLMKDLEAPQIEVAMSVAGSRTAGLNESKLKNVVSDVIMLNQEHEGSVQKLEVTGNPDIDSPSFILNLLNYTMVEVGHVQIGPNRHVTYQERQYAVRKAFVNREDELAERHAQPVPGK